MAVDRRRRPTTRTRRVGFIRNGGSIQRAEDLTIAEYAALPAKDPATLYITFES
ncbi:hypothetical protein G9444_6747 (plasmid) [Rhodococcus erythropolis]|uniref:Minor tail protein gp31 C-terminal domain-containing protein n=1 Tax=Rhodococcus erythropolis TaxID=1833 RepID=A0A6G9D4K6_RHOER|nr:hypothetical protein [Rhodococcus erythropolis]QIP43990.1 hypothetical protein G9444_6747 [Rhodococcus erythropolis]